MVDDHTTTGLGRDATCQAGGPSWGLIALGQAICQVRLALWTFFFYFKACKSVAYWYKLRGDAGAFFAQGKGRKGPSTESVGEGRAGIPAEGAS